MRFLLENVKETLIIGAVSKLQKNFVRGGDVHPHLVCPKGYRCHHIYEEAVYINVYLHVNLTLLKVKIKNKYN